MNAKKRPLFVFAGQSNMMGAAVYPPTAQLRFSDSYEYLHKPRRFGEKQGFFKRTAFPTGEFSYCDLSQAYCPLDDYRSLSCLDNFTKHTFFCPAMSNLLDAQKKSTSTFSIYSEANFQPSPCLPPYLVRDWEARGHVCAYTHIAKGSVSIEYFLNSKQLARFDQECAAVPAGTSRPARAPMTGFSGDYFEEKVNDFFTDSEACFTGEDLSLRALFWLQGENDAERDPTEYRFALKLLWEQARALGFTHFFCIRVGLWENEAIIDIIRAQEQFCRETDHAYMLTRVSSFFPLPGQNESRWFVEKPLAEARNCRDSFFGFDNNHFNQKGFELIASHCIPNLERILFENLPPLLETEQLSLSEM